MFHDQLEILWLNIRREGNSIAVSRIVRELATQVEAFSLFARAPVLVPELVFGVFYACELGRDFVSGFVCAGVVVGLFVQRS